MSPFKEISKVDYGYQAHEMDLEYLEICSYIIFGRMWLIWY
jgi:hypothetical protein